LSATRNGGPVHSVVGKPLHSVAILCFITVVIGNQTQITDDSGQLSFAKRLRHPMTQFGKRVLDDRMLILACSKLQANSRSTCTTAFEGQ
jgi:hypothetical protein